MMCSQLYCATFSVTHGKTVTCSILRSVTGLTINPYSNVYMSVPGKSTNVTSKSFTPYSLDVNWIRSYEIPCPITKYTVKWSQNSDGTDQNNVTESLYKIKGLTPCTDYIITIIAYSYVGPGEPSGTLTSRTVTDVPGKSTNVDSKSITAYSLEMDWSKPLDNPCHINNY
ncbi:unnamed protein product, partial [Meganyctiphanes norvegica]